MRAHVDVIVINDVTTAHFCDNLDEINVFEQVNHHKTDSENEKKSEHHHHCVDMSISNIFTPTYLDLQLSFLPKFLKPIFSYKGLESSTFLDRLFQPPRI